MGLKIFCTAKETINKTKRQSSEWEKIFANEANWQGINLQNIKTAHVVQKKKKKKTIKKRAEDLNRHFSKEYRWLKST